ncbi:MAG: hypothetical protein ACI4QR_03545, partial [Eubacteriales bacterium]
DLRIKYGSYIALCMASLMMSGCIFSGKTDSPYMNIEFKNGQMVYNGNEQYFYQVKEGEVGELEIAVERTSGKLDIIVSCDDIPEHYFYRGTDIPTSSFKVVLPEPGEYRLVVEAEDFAGSYGFEWSVRNAEGEK